MKISKHLIIKPFQGGVALSKPHNDLTDDDARKLNTVENMLNIPMNVYFMDFSSVILAANETTAETCGFSSLKMAIGSKITKAAKKESAEFSMKHDKTVMTIQNVKIAEENFVRRIDDIPMNFISIKLPWYDINSPEKSIGIFGFTISPKEHGLAKSLSLIAQTGLVKTHNVHYLSDQIVNNTYLSKQELRCFSLLGKGLPTKAIAGLLSLSPRTIEHYLENIKIKLQLYSRQELIQIAIDHNANEIS